MTAMAAPAAFSETALYTLTHIDDDTYEVSGPDNRFSMTVVMSQLPAGDWWTEWVGSGDEFILRLTREHSQ